MSSSMLILHLPSPPLLLLSILMSAHDFIDVVYNGTFGICEKHARHLFQIADSRNTGVCVLSGSNVTDMILLLKKLVFLFDRQYSIAQQAKNYYKRGWIYCTGKRFTAKRE